MGLWRNPWIYAGIGALLSLQAAFVYMPFMHSAFGAAAIDAAAWVRALSTALAIVPLVTMEKRWRRWRYRRQRTAAAA